MILAISKDEGVHLMSPGSLFFAKLVMMSSAPAKSAGDARYASQDLFTFYIERKNWSGTGDLSKIRGAERRRFL